VWARCVPAKCLPPLPTEFGPRAVVVSICWASSSPSQPWPWVLGVAAGDSWELPLLQARNLGPRFGERSAFGRVDVRMSLPACGVGDLKPGKPRPHGENQPVSFGWRGVNNNMSWCFFPGWNNAVRFPLGFPGYKLIKPSSVRADVSKYKLSHRSCRCMGTSAGLEHAENGVLCLFFFFLLRKYYNPTNLIFVEYLPCGEWRMGLQMVAVI